MSSSTPAQETVPCGPAVSDARPVPMRALLAATAAAAAVCTPPRPGEAGAGRRRAQAITVTRVPVGAKSQSV
ncbi:hypothetical protein [Kitasatospora mediocidica]|uniref:hypothetical protein n=1 Tax=Kitasatospora mediocidica TaxID=58352 RepID=UPI0005606633|nr:hypothetical protein [Kitasatospora mediocidica]